MQRSALHGHRKAGNAHAKTDERKAAASAFCWRRICGEEHLARADRGAS
jgi:hypothetical protein